MSDIHCEKIRSCFYQVKQIVYRIASNKRPTSRKRLPRINAPFSHIVLYTPPSNKRPLFKGKERKK